MAIKKELLGDNPFIFFISVILLFFLVSEVIATVMTASYHFYFIFVPRVASNRKKLVVWEIAVQILFLCCHEKNSFSHPVPYFELPIYEHMPQVII